MQSTEKHRSFFIGDFETGNIIRQPDYCDPKGPSFASAKHWKIQIEGTTLEFRLPKHKPQEKRNKPMYPKSRVSYRDMWFKRDFNETLNLKDVWEASVFLKNQWCFFGPFLTGPLADISTYFCVINYKEPHATASFFHPRVFETTIADYLTNYYSKIKFNGHHEYIAPVDWAPMLHLSVPGARFKLITDDRVAGYRESELLFFVLDDHHLVIFDFALSRRVFDAYTKADYDRHVGDKNLHESVDNVINSLKVTLSPEVKAQQQKALQGVDDPAVTKTFPPLKWDRNVEAYNETQSKITAK